MGEGDWGGGGEGGVGGVGGASEVALACFNPNGGYPKHCEDVRIAAHTDKIFPMCCRVSRYF